MLELAYRIWQTLRMQLAMTSEADDETCVACGSSDVDVTGEGTYRCRSCGYEGGSGMARKMAEDKRARLNALSPQEKTSKARAHLEQARTLVSSGISELERTKTLGLLDIAGLNIGEALEGRPEGADKFRSLADAMRSLLEARELVVDAGFLLGDDFGPHQAELAGPGIVLGEAEVWMDNAALDALTQLEISTVRADAQKLAAIIEAAWQRHFA